MNTAIENISACANGNSKTACGFIWKHDDVEQLPKEALPGKYALCKTIACYNHDDELVATYESLKEAAEAIGVSCTSISSAAKGKTKTSGGYKWAYL